MPSTCPLRSVRLFCPAGTKNVCYNQRIRVFFFDPTVFQVGGDADLLRALAAGPGAEERQSAQNPAVHSESH